MAALRRQIDDARLAALIDDATHGGRLLAYHVEAARKLGKVDFAALSTLLDRPPLVPLGMQTDALRARGWNPDAARPAATSKVVKPFIFQKRKDYTFIRKDQDGDDNVFRHNEFVYGVEACYGLWQLAYAPDKVLDASRFALARRTMMSLKAPTGKPLGIMPDLLLAAPAFEDDARRLLNLDTSHYKGAMELVVCLWMS